MTPKPETLEFIKKLNQTIEQFTEGSPCGTLEKLEGVTGIIILRFKGEDEIASAVLGNISFTEAIIELVYHGIKSSTLTLKEEEKHAE